MITVDEIRLTKLLLHEDWYEIDEDKIKADIEDCQDIHIKSPEEVKRIIEYFDKKGYTYMLSGDEIIALLDYIYGKEQNVWEENFEEKKD
jgi:hypothetical protein